MNVARPRYGVDAPGITAGLLGGGAALAGASAWLAHRDGAAARAAAVATGIAGGGAALFGGAMLAYGLDGKYRIRDLMLDLVDWRGDERVLDVGSGLGLLAIGAAHRLAGGKVTAIDIWQAKDLSGNTVVAARRNAELVGVADRVAFRRQDARALTDADGCYDVVLSLLCLHNIEPIADRDTACRELARVLKPGGRLVVGDYVLTHRYAEVWAEAGLAVRSTTRHLRAARGLMWITAADKPTG